MYFNDFIKNQPRSKSCRYYLSGSNVFLKNWVANYIAKREGKPLAYAKNAKEYKQATSGSIFGHSSIVVLGPKLDEKHAHDFRIKMGTKKIPKRYKDEGFFEVACNNMFPNHIEEFCSFCCAESGLRLSVETTKFICYVTDHDAYSIYNAVNLLSLVQGAGSLTEEEVVDYCKVLSSSEFYTLMDHFGEEKFSSFLSGVLNSQIKMREFILSFALYVSRLSSIYAHPFAPTTWAQKKMLKAANRLAKYNYAELLKYLRGIISERQLSPESLRFRLNFLLFYMRGEIDVLNQGGI